MWRSCFCFTYHPLPHDTWQFSSIVSQLPTLLPTEAFSGQKREGTGGNPVAYTLNLPDNLLTRLEECNLLFWENALEPRSVLARYVYPRQCIVVLSRDGHGTYHHRCMGLSSSSSSPPSPSSSCLQYNVAYCKQQQNYPRQYIIMGIYTTCREYNCAHATRH